MFAAANTMSGAGAPTLRARILRALTMPALTMQALTMQARTMRSLLLAAACLMGSTTVATAAEQRAAAPPGPVIAGGQEAEIQGLLADVGVDRPLPGGVTFDQTRVLRDRVRYDLRTVATGDLVGSITLLPRSAAVPSDRLTRLYALRVQAVDPQHRKLLGQACDSIAAHEATSIFGAVAPTPHHKPPPDSTSDFTWAALFLCVALCLTALAVLRLQFSAALPAWAQPPGSSQTDSWRERVRFRFKPTHALPAFIQLLIFSYWSIYYSDLSTYFPLMALEVLYAFTLAAALDLHKYGRWTATFGPLPVALSTNLFVLFLHGDGYLTFLAITLALLSQRVFRRDGRHVLNPSSFGVATVGLLTLVFPQLGYGDSAYEFALAPNMSEVILLLALVVQLRVPVVLISASAVSGLLFMGWVTGRISFSPFWAPVLLVVVLLATDPSTSPRRPLAQLMFGFLVGVLMRVSGGLLEWFFHLDLYGKVLGVALANLLVPGCEWLASRSPWQPAWLERRFNPIHVMLWFALMAGGLMEPGTKSSNVTQCGGCQRAHQRNRTPHLVLTRDGNVACADNPLFCDAFTFAKEIALWRSDSPVKSGFQD